MLPFSCHLCEHVQLEPQTIPRTQNRNPSPATLLPGAPQEMAAAGLEADAVAHTILLMAHEKAGAWESALECYATMQRLSLQSNSFTFRQGAAAERAGEGRRHGIRGRPG